MIKSGKDVSKFKEIADKLIHQIPLEKRYREHKLIGQYKGQRECHIEPDWLLIYYIEDDAITFVRTRQQIFLSPFRFLIT